MAWQWVPWQQIDGEWTVDGQDAWVTAWRGAGPAVKLCATKSGANYIAILTVGSPFHARLNALGPTWVKLRTALVQAAQEHADLAALKVPALVFRLRAPEGL